MPALGESAALDPGPATGGSRWTKPVFACAGALLILSIVLFAGRDALFVPLLSGDPDYIGHFIRDARWTSVINASAATALALATLLGVLGAGLALQSRPRVS